ncbi:MAG: T9SS type A sorting domain-containing protein [bacterium]
MKKLLLICFLLLLISGNQSSVLRQAQSAKLNFQHETFIEDSSSTQFTTKNSSQTNPVKSVSQQRLYDMKGSFQFNQVVEDVNGNTTITNLGNFVYTYTPFSNEEYFFNLTIRNHSTGQMAWGIQNLVLPGTNWVNHTQTITVPFPFDIIGYPEGSGFVHLVDYYYEVLTNPMTYPPTGNPGTAEVITTFQENLSEGVITNSTPAANPISWYPDLWEGLLPNDFVYISCSPDDPQSMPNIDLDNSARDGEKNGCGPAAAANSLNWLKKMHPEINFPADLRETFNQISSLMSRQKNTGVSVKNIIQGKVNFAEMYNLPIKVKYQCDDNEGPIQSSTRRTQAECKDANSTSFPTKDFLKNEAKNGEDIEIVVFFPEDMGGGGHALVLNGIAFYNNDSYINVKDDGKQSTEGGTRNRYCRILVEDGKIKIPAVKNGTLAAIISESYDPNYIPPPTNVEFGNYCRITRRLIPPGHKVIVTFPEDATSSYSTTVWQINKWDETAPYRKLGTWNFNGNKEQTLTNPTDEPALIAFHNDDNARSSLRNPFLKEGMYEPYTIDISPAEPADAGDETSPFNESDYAGFSMGWDDDSADEFGDSTAATVNFTVETGCSLGDLPQSLNPNGTTRLNVNYTIPEINKYWSDLEFKLGIVSVETPGTVTLSFSNSPVPQTIEITTDTRDISLPIGGVQHSGNFSFSISTVGTNTAFTIDNIGIPTNVPMVPSSVDDNEVIPDQFLLMQNYPNPFNPTTSIKYQVSSIIRVKIAVYDLLGKEVATLVDEVKEAGTYQIEFDGSGLASGIYFYKMTAGNFSDIKKCAILK